MTDKTDRKVEAKIAPREIVFKCQFCGETKPFSEMIMMRQFYPQLSACKACAMAHCNTPHAE
jgi:hypothetical protein